MARIPVGEPSVKEELKVYATDPKAGTCRVYRITYTPLGDIVRKNERRWEIGDDYWFPTVDMAMTHVARDARPELEPGTYRVPPVESVEQGGDGQVRIKLRDGRAITLQSD